MIEQISKEIKEVLNSFSSEDKIIFNGRTIELNKGFKGINDKEGEKTVAFVDGGQTEVISTGNFCLSFIRIFAQVFKGQEKLNSYKKEFYLFTRAKWIEGELFYQSKIYGDRAIDEKDLLISSNDITIKKGVERASVSKVANIARRFAELSLGSSIEANFIVLDGTLEKSYRNEEKYLGKLSAGVCALAKSCSLFTVSGNNPMILLNKLCPPGCWSYFVDNKTSFVKLHPLAKHVFRFEGNLEVLPYLVENSRDAVFLGYPYGLMLADRFARVSNAEKSSLKASFLLRAENKEIGKYLSSSNAHDILDNLG
ncbi:DNA double-strand break repair nuclease NurA [Candidatus Woesearchaeota archaeon]|jgi:hypothetical protein|nr:DNA double-strand break repair nuclease NurA [Candidatus Woesearchaeota archaeon]